MILMILVAMNHQAHIAWNINLKEYCAGNDMEIVSNAVSVSESVAKMIGR